jgi:hypothetical protein
MVPAHHPLHRHQSFVQSSPFDEKTKGLGDEDDDEDDEDGSLRR